MRERICVDRNRMTGGGVTAGIDFGLYLAGRLAGETAAQVIQLNLEYAPKPPFAAGELKTAPEEVRAAYEQVSEANMERRAEAVGRAAAALARMPPVGVS